jgi:uncharacterized protein (DUF1501 family)
MNTKKDLSRRRFLNTSLMCGGSALAYSSGLLALVNASHALASNANDYKALIYVFLEGGNDANNMLVPMGDNDLRSRYEKHRGIVALSEETLHPITLNKPAQIYPNDVHLQFGLHAKCSSLAQMFNQQELSLVCNVGNLLEPTTREQFEQESVSLPPQLFSHADQQKQYQSEPSSQFTFGWGGRTAELLTSKNTETSVSPLISLSGLNSFQVSKDSVLNPFVFTETGVPEVSGYNGIKKAMLDKFFTSSSEDTHLMAAKYQQTFNSMQSAKIVIDSAFDYAQTNGIDYDQIFSDAGAADSGIGKRLKTIVKFIAGRETNQNKRPIFYVKMNGFDTHQNLLADHEILMEELNNALSALNTSLKAQGDFDSVLTFCGSEFGRTLTPNGKDQSAGTDHAWGGHALLMGGMVNGGNLFGTHPDLRVGQGLDADNKRGRWIPTTPTSHVSALIAHWFGLEKSQLTDVFPSMINFDDPFDESENLELFKGEVL